MFKPIFMKNRAKCNWVKDLPFLSQNVPRVFKSLTSTECWTGSRFQRLCLYVPGIKVEGLWLFYKTPAIVYTNLSHEKEQYSYSKPFSINWVHFQCRVFRWYFFIEILIYHIVSKKVWGQASNQTRYQLL